MANNGVPGSVPIGHVQAAQAARPVATKTAGGNSVPLGGKAATPSANYVPHGAVPQTEPTSAGKGASASPAKKPSPPPASPDAGKSQVLVTQLNKYLNDSGRPDQFRVDPASRGQTIQQINPATGEVIGEFSTAQFPELARSLGVTGVLIDSRA